MNPFLVWYRAKVLNVLHGPFEYKPAVPGIQAASFNEVTRHIRKLGGNEYDGAIAFMMVQANALMGDDPEVRDFKERVDFVIESLMPRTKLGADLTH